MNGRLGMARPTAMPATVPDRVAAPVAHTSPRRIPAVYAYAGLMVAGALFSTSYLLADRGYQHGVHETFWAGLAVAVISFYARAFRSSSLGRSEGFRLALAAGALFYVPKVLRSPHAFTFFDELTHYRTTQLLLAGHGLPVPNPMNPVVEYYPGLHLATATLASTSGLSVFAAGILLIGVAHTTLAGAVYVLYVRIRPDPGFALLGVLVYATTPAFFYFDSQFSYESLALPLLVTGLILALRFAGRTVPLRRAWELPVVALLIVALMVTHHITAYLFALALAVFAASALTIKRPRGTSPLKLAVAALLGPVIWTLAVAPYTWQYFSPIADDFGSITSVLGGSKSARTLFAGTPIPWYETLATAGFALLACAAVPLGAVRIWRRPDLRESASFRAFLAISLVFPLSLPLAWLDTQDVAKRAWEFAFIGLAPVAALVLITLLRHSRRSVRYIGLALFFVAFMGGITAQSGENIRFPGPYVSSADPWSDTPDLRAAARWMLQHYGRGNRVMGDRTASAVFAADGLQTPVTYQYFGYAPWIVFFPTRLSPSVFQQLNTSHTRFLVIDRRIDTSAPLTGFYFAPAEPGAPRTRPISVESLAKFNSPPFERVYNNGNISIYLYSG
jgi:hypothetical protein